jgi:hypothetical protein
MPSIFTAQFAARRTLGHWCLVPRGSPVRLATAGRAAGFRRRQSRLCVLCTVPNYCAQLTDTLTVLRQLLAHSTSSPLPNSGLLSFLICSSCAIYPSTAANWASRVFLPSLSVFAPLAHLHRTHSAASPCAGHGSASPDSRV